MSRRPGASHRGGGRPDRLSRDAVTSARRGPAAPVAADPTLVLLGEFGRPHGLRGEVRLKSYTGDPLAIAGYGLLSSSAGGTVELLDVRPAPGASPDILIARVKGVADRTGAEALTRVTLALPRERLGSVEDEDEFFLADLVGLAVVDCEGRPLGSVTAVPNYGGGDLLEIRPAAGGPSALLPFTKAFVPSIDLAAGRIVADPPDDLFAPPGTKPPDDPG